MSRRERTRVEQVTRLVGTFFARRGNECWFLLGDGRGARLSAQEAARHKARLIEEALALDATARRNLRLIPVVLPMLLLAGLLGLTEQTFGLGLPVAALIVPICVIFAGQSMRRNSANLSELRLRLPHELEARIEPLPGVGHKLVEMLPLAVLGCVMLCLELALWAMWWTRRGRALPQFPPWSGFVFVAGIYMATFTLMHLRKRLGIGQL